MDRVTAASFLHLTPISIERSRRHLADHRCDLKRHYTSWAHILESYNPHCAKTASSYRPGSQPAPGQLLRVRACGVCRTDLHVVESELPPRTRPQISGVGGFDHTVSIGRCFLPAA